MTTIFGPVPSRRLGRSLGIDLIPAKTCSFDCIYCESGRTTHLSVKRRAFVPPERVIEDLEAYFRCHPTGADVLTLSGAGEPTLYEPLGELICDIKRHFAHLPLVVLTNASLFRDEKVRKDLLQADLVMPSLDAATEDIYSRVNRPHPDLDLGELLEGLKAFSREYRGRVSLEVMLVQGLNDNPSHLKELRRLIDLLSPDEVALNTVVRPPADPDVRGLSHDEMQAAMRFFPADKTKVIGVFQASTGCDQSIGLEFRIIEMVRRRPCGVAEMASSLGVPPEAVHEALGRLLRDGSLVRRSFDATEYICVGRPEASEPSA
jgi:wyosine [tRNA(Phe)-imidazoG37] synthetase (radical SAM superfamily)